MRFVSSGKDEHVPELSMSRPEDVGDNESLMINDVIKSLGALYGSSDAGSSGLQDLRLVYLFFLGRTRRAHAAVFPLHCLRGEGR